MAASDGGYWKLRKKISAYSCSAPDDKIIKVVYLEVRLYSKETKTLLGC